MGKSGEQGKGIALDLGLTKQTISDIIHRKTWGWLDAPVESEG
ncbi:MAG: hypothetical protein ACRDGQ_06680 [Candidatus Limnocylindrales bacterium]